MENKKKYLSEKKFYPVFFMVVLTVILVGALAIFYHLTQDRVQSYKTGQLQKIVLQTFELPIDPVGQNYHRYIKEESQYGFDYYRATRNGVILGYCFPMEGSGLWGTIRALIALNEDFSQLIGLTIIEQNETPGLGARITEDWFQKQFKEKRIIRNGEVIKYILIPEDEVQQENEIQQITGATASSRAVVNMLYKNLIEIIHSFKIQ